MATYVPNATDFTEPLESQTVESAALEFRTLKARVNALDAAVAADDLTDLRVPETSIAVLPAIASRAGKVLGFDAGGNPAMVDVAGATDPSLRSDLAASSGVSLVGYLPAGTGAVSTTVFSVLDRQQNDIADLLTSQQIADIKAGTSVLDLSSRIQSLIDLREPFKLIPGGVHYCESALNWHAGASMSGGNIAGNIPDDAIPVTKLLFNNTLTTTGILFADTTPWTCNFEISGVVIDTTNKSLAWTNFTAVKVASTCKGVYNFRLTDFQITNAQYGFYIESNFFTFIFSNVAVQYAYMGFYKSTVGAITSGTFDWLKLTSCFHGVSIASMFYTRMNVYYDHVGLSMFHHTLPGLLTAMPADEMPIMQDFNVVHNLSGTAGLEFCNAINTRARVYSSISQNMDVQLTPAEAWYKSAVRVANIPEAEQAYFVLQTSTLSLTNFNLGCAPPDYPAASTVDPSYFYRDLSTGNDKSRLIFNSGYLYLLNYCVYPASTNQSSLTALLTHNQQVEFGATNISRYSPEAVSAAFFSDAVELPSVATATPTALYTFPAKDALYLVTVMGGNSSNGHSYSAFAIVATRSTGLRIMSQVDGSLLALTGAGLILSVTQTSGVPFRVRCAVTQVFKFW